MDPSRFERLKQIIVLGGKAPQLYDRLPQIGVSFRRFDLARLTAIGTKFANIATHCLVIALPSPPESLPSERQVGLKIAKQKLLCLTEITIQLVPMPQVGKSHPLPD